MDVTLTQNYTLKTLYNSIYINYDVDFSTCVEVTGMKHVTL
jgi:hypothetical protein